MDKWQYKLLTALLLFGMSACGGSESGESQSTARPPAQAPMVEAVAKKNPQTKPVEAMRESNKTYRSVTAKSRDDGSAIEIMVPSDVEIGPGRLIEYHDDVDGKRYFVSLIPQ